MSLASLALARRSRWLPFRPESLPFGSLGVFFEYLHLIIADSSLEFPVPARPADHNCGIWNFGFQDINPDDAPSHWSSGLLATYQSSTALFNASLETLTYNSYAHHQIGPQWMMEDAGPEGIPDGPTFFAVGPETLSRTELWNEGHG
ncbi:hypothetical protein F5883DRAFT_529994 [Diaporthe sp. PMI_573]|nr:hypothetical protein F5883DRAFT_529994 [Diaporthaceae sp. PMI_573]